MHSWLMSLLFTIYQLDSQYAIDNNKIIIITTKQLCQFLKESYQFRDHLSYLLKSLSIDKIIFQSNSPSLKTLDLIRR